MRPPSRIKTHFETVRESLVQNLAVFRNLPIGTRLAIVLDRIEWQLSFPSDLPKFASSPQMTLGPFFPFHLQQLIRPTEYAPTSPRPAAFFMRGWPVGAKIGLKKRKPIRSSNSSWLNLFGLSQVETRIPIRDVFRSRIDTAAKIWLVNSVS